MSYFKPSVLTECCRPQHPEEYPSLSIRFLLYSSTTIAVLFLVAMTFQMVSTPTQAQSYTVLPEQPSPLMSTVPPMTERQTPSPTVEPTLPPGTVTAYIAEYSAIRSYIKTIFDTNAKTAYAIAFAESGKVDRETRKPYFNAGAINRSDIELSVGVFQVNLKNKDAKVHWDRIPGITEAQKIEWLQNPYNNVLYAYWVFSYSTFNPWTTFTDGTYLKYLKQ